MHLHLADRVLNRPLLLTAEKAQVVLAVLGSKIGLAPDASRFVGENFEVEAGGRVIEKPYRVANGVAIITIIGSLVNRGAWVGASSGLTSYEGIAHQLHTAREDPAVHAVILDLNSPGGEAIGAFETATLVRQLSAKKRTVALVNGMACSAAYAIASGANEIVTIETGVSGSIGVVLLHADFSRKLDREGISPTLIHAGAHKVDGNPFEPLPDAVRESLQAEVDSFYSAFLSCVAQGRGKRLDIEKARQTEARTFIGQAAVSTGIADRVGTFERVLAELSRATPSGGRSTSQTRRSSMSETSGAPAANEDAGIPAADHQAAVTTARAEGEAAGSKAATDRLVAALGAEGVKGDAVRMQAALDLAQKSPTMSGEDVAAHVTAYVNTSSQSTAQTYESTRLAAAGLAASGASSGKKPTLNTADIYKARRNAKEG